MLWYFRYIKCFHASTNTTIHNQPQSFTLIGKSDKQNMCVNVTPKYNSHPFQFENKNIEKEERENIIENPAFKGPSNHSICMASKKKTEKQKKKWSYHSSLIKRRQPYIFHHTFICNIKALPFVIEFSAHDARSSL